MLVCIAEIRRKLRRLWLHWNWKLLLVILVMPILEFIFKPSVVSGYRCHKPCWVSGWEDNWGGCYGIDWVGNMGPCVLQGRTRKCKYDFYAFSDIFSTKHIDFDILHAKPWIAGGEKLIFMVVIHLWISPSCQFAHAKAIDEYDVTMPVPHVRVNITDQLAMMAKSAIDNCL